MITMRGNINPCQTWARGSPVAHQVTGKSYQRLGIGCADCGTPSQNQWGIWPGITRPVTSQLQEAVATKMAKIQSMPEPRSDRGCVGMLGTHCRDPAGGAAVGRRRKYPGYSARCTPPAGSAGPSSIRVVNTLYLRQKWRPRGGARARQNYGRPYPRSTPGNRGCQMPPNTWEIRPGEQGHDREIQYRKSWPTLAAAATAAGTSGLQGRIDANWHYAPSIPRPVRGRNSLNPGQSRDARGAQRVANNSSGDEPRLDAGAASPGRSNIAAKRGEAARHLHKWEKRNLRLYSEGTWGI